MLNFWWKTSLKHWKFENSRKWAEGISLRDVKIYFFTQKTADRSVYCLGVCWKFNLFGLDIRLIFILQIYKYFQFSVITFDPKVLPKVDMPNTYQNLKSNLAKIVCRQFLAQPPIRCEIPVFLQKSWEVKKEKNCNFCLIP
jgi:hypothetical protein